MLRTVVLALASGCSWVFPLEESACPASYTTVIGDSKYRRMTQPNTFSSAAESCFDEGTHLAVIADDTERLAVGIMFDANGDWIGMHDRNDDGVFTILSDEATNYPPTTGSLWVGGGLNGANCVALGMNGLFIGAGCMETRPATCECDRYRENDSWRDGD
ncbi:MAG TPA: C-type lectin domain-containing protein [Kofleriaceae bacterium]